MAEVATSSHDTPEWAKRFRKTLPPAIVLRWNDVSAYAICPFPDCGRLHRHGSKRASEGYPNRRLSHCEKLQQEYQLVWPFEAGGIAQDLELGFELDRDAGFWRTLGTDIEDPEEEIPEEPSQGTDECCSGEEGLLASMNRLQLSNDAYRLFVFHCVSNCIHEAASCLAEMVSVHPFLHRKGTNGNTTLALACMEGHLEMVEYLVEKGSPIESRNLEGETPLIVSLKYEQDTIARYLVDCGPVVSSRDRYGSSVLSHARTLLETLEEARIHVNAPSYTGDLAPPEEAVVRNDKGDVVLRYRKDPNCSINMKYHEHQERIDRVQIIINACIAYETTQKRIRKHRKARAKKALSRKVSISPSAVRAMVTVFRDAYQVPMANFWKTFAYLDRGEPHDLVFAVSGWSGGKFADTDGCIKRELWTERVFEFSRIVGHSLARHAHDDLGREGSFHACHAEKQLMAFILWHYTYLKERPDDEAPDEEWERYESMLKWHQCDGGCVARPPTNSKYCKAYCAPPVDTIKPVIHVTNDVCPDCKGFNERILACTGIEITLKRS